jgi:hypothetical protein
MNDEKKLLSQRGQDHLLRLNRQLALSMRELDRKLTRLVGAIQACDLKTQQQCFGEYIVDLANHLKTVEQITQFIENRFDINIADEHASRS